MQTRKGGKLALGVPMSKESKYLVWIRHFTHSKFNTSMEKQVIEAGVKHH